LEQCRKSLLAYVSLITQEDYVEYLVRRDGRKERIMNKLLSVVLATILIVYGTVVPVSAETGTGTNTTSRLAGQNRYQTSEAIAEAFNNNDMCDNVILALGNDFPDALSASILSKKLNAPILLVDTQANASTEAFNFIAAHLSKTGTIYIVGGAAVIGSDFESKFGSMGYNNIKRFDGTNRYDTNMLIVNNVNVPQGTPIFIASGENFPDALSVSSFSGAKQYPILLVGQDTLPTETGNFIANDKPSTIYIAGGTGVISQDIENQVKALVPMATVKRLAGDDRFGTNTAIINEFSTTPQAIYLASGNDFPDALAGGGLAAKTGDPILLVDNQSMTLPPAVETYLNKLYGLGIQPNVIALGGMSVVSNILIQQAKNALCGMPPMVNSKIASGIENYAAYYLDSSGHVWAWGSGGFGQLGNGAGNDSATPVQVSNLSHIVAIAGGDNQGQALDKSGHVWIWGRYGNTSQNGYPIYGSNVPVEISNLQNIVAIAEDCALDSSGHVWTWKEKSKLDLSPGDPFTPEQIPGLTDIVSIAGGNGIACALDISGHVWTWGSWVSGSCTSSVQIPNISDAVAIAAGAGTDYILDSSGHVWMANYGSGSSATTIKINDSTATTDYSHAPVQLTNLSNIIAIAAGFGLFVLDKHGNVWRYNDYGLNGYQISNLTDTDIVEIAGGGGANYALTSKGQVWKSEWSNDVSVQVFGFPK